jgi:sugar/nucleoside kinase (ribokinase family)
MPKTLDVLGLGCTAVDDLVFVPQFPAADSKLRVSRRERQCGGLTATALVAAARLEARAAYAGTLGEDADSAFVRTALERAGVQTNLVVRQPGVRPVRSVILVDETTGSRTILYDVSQAGGAHPRRPAAAVFARSRVLLVDGWGMEGQLRAARLARRAGVPVVGDLESFDRPRFEELLALTDHLIVSEDFARRYTGAAEAAEGARRLWRPDRAVVVVTCGAQGGWWLAAGMAGPRRYAAFSVPVVDTTGCGDVFHGAYAAALARGWPLEERLRVAAAAAALKATRPGGQAGCPSWAAVRSLLRRAAGGGAA